MVYGDSCRISAVAETTVRKWFTRFRNGNFNLENRERSGRPVVDDDCILTLIENNPRHTTRDIAEILHISHMNVIRHLKTHEYINRYDVWVSHNLTEKNLMDRICDSLFKRNENDSFFKRIITGDEKWIVYINVDRKRS